MAEAKVSSLLTNDLKTWNWNLIAQGFSSEITEAICSIQVGLSLGDNGWFCSSEEKGISLRSAYRVTFNHRFGDLLEKDADDSIWSRITRLKASPKVKVFLWRACSNFLPTRPNLMKRRMQITDGCSLCDYETIRVAYLWQMHICQGVMIQQDNGYNMWNNRNAQVHGNRVAPAALETEEKKDDGSKWDPPPAGWFKINVDAGKKAKKVMSSGAVVQDHGVKW
ncbi:hypothetical protein Droror1_Dr00015673 [Drosera rotundifolia]